MSSLHPFPLWRPARSIRNLGLLAASLVIALHAADSAAPANASTAADRLGFHFAPPSAAKPVSSTALQRAGQSSLPTVGPVIVLPKVVVKERPVKLTPRDVMTDAEKTRLAERTYLSPLYQATLGPLSQIAGYIMNVPSILSGWHPNAAEARVLYEQDEVLRRQREMNDLQRLDAYGEKVDTQIQKDSH